jgi:uncharacterized SAM-binding protein YcdF (DUF218 family)
VPRDNLRAVRRTLPVTRSKVLVWTAGIALAGGILWVLWVEGQIRYYARQDEARPADAIAVFGAAEYDGRPSPVLRARLDHALELYNRGLAPLIITLGGGEAEDLHSEGGVGHDYLLAHGVPDKDVIAETQSDDTEESARRLAVIARANGLRTIDVVSDGTHLFRIHAICEKDGLQVYTSPRPVGRSIPFSQRFERLAHEILSYTAWRLKLH